MIREGNELIVRLQSFVFSLNFLFYLLEALFDWTLINVILSVLTICSIILSVPLLQGLSLLLSLLFLILGLGLQVSSGTSFEAFFYSFSRIPNIITFLGLIPILAIPSRILFSSTKNGLNLLYSIQSKRQLFLNGQTLSFGLSSVMNMGAVPMVWTFLENVKQDFDNKRTLSTSITRGFALAMLWSPVGAGVAIVVELTDLTVITLIPFTISIALLGLLIDRIIYYFLDKTTVKKQKVAFDHKTLKLIVLIVIPLIIFMVCTIALDLVLPFGMLYIISLITVPFTLLWSIVINRFKCYRSMLTEHIKHNVPKMYYQIGILLAASFFVNSLSHEKHTVILNHLFTIISDQVGVGTLLIIGMLTVILLSIIGVHQFVAVSLVGSMLNISGMGLPRVIFAVGLLTSLCIGIMISPFNGTTALMSSLIKDTPFNITKWNTQFSFIFFVVVVCFLIINI